MIFYDVFMHLLVYAPPHTHTFGILYMKYMHILHCMIMQKIMSGLVTTFQLLKCLPDCTEWTVVEI